MSTLAAIAYPNTEVAEKVRQELIGLTREHLVELDDAVVVENDVDGRIKLHQAMNTTSAGAAGGAMWGGLIGLIFLAPFVGMAVGAASGALAGKTADVGVDDKFMEELGSHLSPGTAALIVLARSSAPDKLLARISPYGGEVLMTSLDQETENRLRSALGESVPA
jgi:uncharacterized membrane protein